MKNLLMRPWAPLVALMLGLTTLTNWGMMKNPDGSYTQDGVTIQVVQGNTLEQNADSRVTFNTAIHTKVYKDVVPLLETYKTTPYGRTYEVAWRCKPKNQYLVFFAQDTRLDDATVYKVALHVALRCNFDDACTSIALNCSIPYLQRNCDYSHLIKNIISQLKTDEKANKLQKLILVCDPWDHATYKGLLGALEIYSQASNLQTAQATTTTLVPTASIPVRSAWHRFYHSQFFKPVVAGCCLALAGWCALKWYNNR